MDTGELNKELSSTKARLAELEAQNTKLITQLQRLFPEAIHDQDTQLYSNAYFHTRLKEEIVRSERYRHYLSLILIHVELKDRQSTQQITREISRIGRELMSGLTRRNDVVALYSKRQMIVMLPETGPRGAALLMNRFMSTFPNNGRRMTCSILSYPNDATNIEMVLNQIHERSENLFRGVTKA
ncbi:GGDEF domain-containing protein [bacterium]|nr:GGDEF domain-containing protein [bacterium]